MASEGLLYMLFLQDGLLQGAVLEGGLVRLGHIGCLDGFGSLFLRHESLVILLLIESLELWRHELVVKLDLAHLFFSGGFLLPAAVGDVRVFVPPAHWDYRL